MQGMMLKWFRNPGHVGPCTSMYEICILLKIRSYWRDLSKEVMSFYLSFQWITMAIVYRVDHGGGCDKCGSKLIRELLINTK